MDKKEQKLISKSRCKCKILNVFLGIVFLINLLIGGMVGAQAQELSLNINVDVNGEAFVLGTSSVNPNINGINFANKTISGFTQDLTVKQGEKWTFNLNLKDNYSDYDIRLKLPKNAKVTFYSGQPLISSEQGYLILEYSGVGEINLDVQYTLEKVQTQIDWKNVVVFITLIILIIVMIILFLRTSRHKKELEKKIKERKKPKLKKEEKLKDIMKILNERENLIVGLLKKEGKTTHGRLQKMSGIPKASFSRHLNNLAKKGIVHKEGSGRLNLIRLKIK